MGNALRKQPAAAVDLEELFLQLEQQRAADSAAVPGGQQAQIAKATAPAAAPTATGSAWIAEAGLFFVMGMSGWWVANAIYAETPIFVSDTPEEQAIGNLLGVATQIGNVFPFLFKMLSKQRQVELLGRSILGCQLAAIAAALLTALMWRSTIGQHSVWLVLSMIVSGGVGTLSNVTYWALASRYDGVHCTKAMSVGSTVGGLVSAGMAIAQVRCVSYFRLSHSLSHAKLIRRRGEQEAGHDPRFSLSTFMVMVALVQVGFLLAFLVVLKNDPAATESSQTPSATSAANAARNGDHALTRTPSRADLAVDLDEPLMVDDPQPGAHSEPEHSQGTGISTWLQKAILVTMFAIYAQTYSLQTLQPFMVQGYAATCEPVSDGSAAAELPASACLCELNEDHTSCAAVAADCSVGNCAFGAPSASGPSDDDLLRYMYFMQQFGDVTGRMATTVPYTPSVLVVLVLIGLVFAVSVTFITAAASPTVVATVLPGSWAMVLPLLFFLYYFTRGYVVTVLYVLVKQQSATQKEAESMSGNMGLCGQIGAMLANAVLFVAVQLG